MVPFTSTHDHRIDRQQPPESLQPAPTTDRVPSDLQVKTDVDLKILTNSDPPC